MGYVVMPRNHYTTTKTGIVIGCAHINYLPPTIDEHTTIIQQLLLNNYRNPSKDKCIRRTYAIGVMALIVAIAFFV